MKIGIYTLHGAQNVGAFLQALSTQETLKQLGHEPMLVEIPVDSASSAKSSGTLQKVWKYLKRGGIPFVYFKYQMAKKFAGVRHMLQKGRVAAGETLDAAVMGSDEIWNIENPTFYHHSAYFAIDVPAIKKIAYAACAGGVTSTVLVSANLDFSNFDFLSVRDESTATLVEDMTGISPTRVCDPTLLIDTLVPFAKPIDEHGYIMVYSYGIPKKQIKEIKAFAKKMGKKLVSVATYNSWCDRNVVADPLEFLGWLINADFVITSTFHGAVLSTKFHKQYAVFCKGSLKVLDFLSYMHLEGRLVKENNSLMDIQAFPIDYELVEEELCTYRAQSMEYLLQALEADL